MRLVKGDTRDLDDSSDAPVGSQSPFHVVFLLNLPLHDN